MSTQIMPYQSTREPEIDWYLFLSAMSMNLPMYTYHYF